MKLISPVYLNFLSTVTEFIFRRRLLFLTLLVLAHYALVASSGGRWSGDFWEHSAVVNAFIAAPFSPRHPQLDVEAAHAFLNPYGFFVAIVALMAHIDAISALAVFGAVNFITLVLGLRQFIATTQHNDTSGITFYTLILAMFLWGKDAWQFSGFYNFDILTDVLPYPSTLAFGMSLFALAIFARLLNSPSSPPRHVNIRSYAGIVSIAALVLLIHPLTAVFLWVALASQALTYGYSKWSAWLSLCISIGFSIAVTTFWPFFSITRLMLREGAAYHLSNASMYLEVIQGTWPILMLLPLILWQATKINNRAIAASMLVLLSLYVWGYYSKQYSFGRSIAFFILLSNILVAQCLCELEQWCARRGISYLKILVATALLITASGWLYQSSSRLLTVANSIYLGRPIASQISYRDLMFLKNHVEPNAVVLADIDSSWILPTLSGKAVATKHPLAFVPDWYVRKEAVITFFKSDTSVENRRAIVEKYRPNYLLVNKTNSIPWHDIQAEFNSVSKLIVNNPNYILLKLNN